MKDHCMYMFSSSSLFLCFYFIYTYCQLVPIIFLSVPVSEMIRGIYASNFINTVAGCFLVQKGHVQGRDQGVLGLGFGDTALPVQP